MNENEFENLKPITAAGTSGETYNDFSEYKKAFDTVLLNTANNFVRIGYLLKYARDTDILAESGHDSLVDFAKAEYGLDKTQVSRFIAINDRFSKGGYGDALEDKYVNFGYAKLSIMLTLPEQITEDLAPEMTKAEITDLKKEVDAELQITDIEVALEEKEEVVSEITETGLVIRELVKSYPKLYKSLHGIFASDNKNKLPDELAPNGKDLYVVRVAGVGKFTVTADKTAGLSIVNMRSLEKTALCWKETSDEMQKWFNVGMGAAASWESFFATKLDSDDKAPADNKKPVIDNKTIENEHKTAKTDEKPQKTEENSNKPNKTESKPEEKKRVHKPEKVEKKTEEPAPKEEAETSGPSEGSPVDPEEQLYADSSVAPRDFMPEPVEEIEPGTLGYLKVVKDEVGPVQQDRIIEVREEIDIAKFAIDCEADVETQKKQTSYAIDKEYSFMKPELVTLEEQAMVDYEFSSVSKATRRDWIWDAVAAAQRITEHVHNIELLERYLTELEEKEREAEEE